MIELKIMLDTDRCDDEYYHIKLLYTCNINNEKHSFNEYLPIESESQIRDRCIDKIFYNLKRKVKEHKEIFDKLLQERKI